MVRSLFSLQYTGRSTYDRQVPPHLPTRTVAHNLHSSLCLTADLFFCNSFFLRRYTRHSFTFWADTAAALVLAILKDVIFLWTLGRCGAWIGGLCCSCYLSKRNYLERMRRLVLDDSNRNTELRRAHHRVPDFDRNRECTGIWRVQRLHCDFLEDDHRHSTWGAEQPDSDLDCGQHGGGQDNREDNGNSLPELNSHVSPSIETQFCSGKIEGEEGLALSIFETRATNSYSGAQSGAGG